MNKTFTLDFKIKIFDSINTLLLLDYSKIHQSLQICVYIRIYVHMYLYVHIYIDIYTHIFIYMYICICESIFYVLNGEKRKPRVLLTNKEN